jgi:hypothetical protein
MGEDLKSAADELHEVMENRKGPVAGMGHSGDGTVERRAAEALLKRKARRRGAGFPEPYMIFRRMV